MQTRALVAPAGYAPGAAAVRMLAAQLDPLLQSLAARVREATIPDLEWQPRPGTNTIGMLLTHLAVSETYWMQAAVRGIDSDQEVDRIVRDTLGIGVDDDGMPLAPGGSHPPSLAGKSATAYLEILCRARQATHATLASWNDAELDHVVTVGDARLTRGWMLFHIVDHFAQHSGQIALLTSLRRRSEL